MLTSTLPLRVQISQGLGPVVQIELSITGRMRATSSIRLSDATLGSKVAARFIAGESKQAVRSEVETVTCSEGGMIRLETLIELKVLNPSCLSLSSC